MGSISKAPNQRSSVKPPLRIAHSGAVALTAEQSPEPLTENLYTEPGFRSEGGYLQGWLASRPQQLCGRSLSCVWGFESLGFGFMVLWVQRLVSI